MARRAGEAISEFDAGIGLKLRAARLKAGFTAEQLAVRSDLSAQQIQKYETGKNRISASRLFYFAELLDKPIAHFFDDVPDLLEQDGALQLERKIREFATTDEGKALLDSFQRIRDARTRRELITLLKTIAAPDEL